MTRTLTTILPIYLLAATALGFIDYRARTHIDRGFEGYPRAVVDNTEDPPGKYRVLAPYVFEGAVSVTGASRDVVWVGFRWLCLLAGLLATHALLLTWFTPATAVAGSLLNGVLLLLTFTNSWGHPDHFVEWALVAAAMTAIARGRFAWTVLWLALAALNRETSFVIVLLFAAARPWTRRHLSQVAAASSIWLVVYLGLRFFRGVAWYDPWQLSRNVEFLGLLPAGFDPYYRAYAWFGPLIVGLGALLAAQSWSRQPRLIRGGVVVAIPVFAVVALLFSSIIETRIFTPLLPIVAAAVMFALSPADRTTAA